MKILRKKKISPEPRLQKFLVTVAIIIILQFIYLF